MLTCFQNDKKVLTFELRILLISKSFDFVAVVAFKTRLGFCRRGGVCRVVVLFAVTDG